MSTPEIADLISQINDLNATAADLINAVDIVWILSTGFLIFWMQTGFLVLEAGTVRITSAQNIVMKNILDILISAVAYWILGYGFSFGDEGNGFISYSNFGLDSFSDYHLWFFFWVFLAAACTIISGAMAERTSILAYLVISFTFSAFVWPVVAHWAWSSQGWFSPFRAEGCCLDFIDFAGSTVVHTTGGLVGLIGAIALGPRVNRFDAEYKQSFDPNNTLFVVLGVFILWFGWYGFNAGSTLAATGGLINVSSRVVVNTTISPCFAGICVFSMARVFEGHFNLVALGNGILVGLVGITAGCSVVDPWGAMLIGIIVSPIYYGISRLILWLKIDDPLDAFAVHAGAGTWGTLAVGLFATKSGMSSAYGFDPDTEYIGAFVTDSNGQLLGTQLVGIIVVWLWIIFWFVPLLFGLKWAGLLRISAEEEKGLDKATFGASIFNFRTGGEQVDLNVFKNASIPVLYDINLGETLGSGNFGEVLRGDWKGTTVALKLVQEEDVETFTNELRILFENRHPSVLNFFGIFSKNEETNKIYMVTEFMEKGDLRSLLIEDIEIGINELVNMSTQAASGMEYLHSRSIIHRDLACRNLLVGGSRGNYNIKVADFGLSRVVEDYYVSNSNKIPIRWTAPEALQFRKFTKASDVWAFGIVLWEIFSRGSVPYSGLKNDQVAQSVAEGLRMEPPPYTPERLQFLMYACWEPAPEERPDFQLIHQVLVTVSKEDMNDQNTLVKAPPQKNAPKDLYLGNTNANTEPVRENHYAPHTGPRSDTSSLGMKDIPHITPTIISDVPSSATSSTPPPNTGKNQPPAQMQKMQEIRQMYGNNKEK